MVTFSNYCCVYLIQSGHSKPQGAVLHDHRTNGENVFTMAKPSKHITYLDDVASQLSSFDDEQSKANEPIRSNNDSEILNQTARSCDTTARSHDHTSCDVSSHDPDHDGSCDLNHDSLSISEAETSCEHNNTQLDDSVIVEDNDISNDDNDDGVEDAKGFQYQFTSANFIVKVCDGHINLSSNSYHWASQ